MHAIELLSHLPKSHESVKTTATARTGATPLRAPIAYDMTRLFWGPLSRTPRGIDRVELVLANQIFSAKDRPVFGVLPTAWGTRVFDAQTIRSGLRELEAIWAENQTVETDTRLSALAKRLNGNLDIRLSNGKPLSLRERAARMIRLIRATGFSFGRSATRTLPKGAVYVNIGQILLAAPILMGWLRKRPDVTPVFMLHDVIPLDMPTHVAPSSVRHHRRMIKTTARFAKALIVTTDYVKQTVSDAITHYRATPLPTLAQSLPVAEAFTSVSSWVSQLDSVRYFVVCGSIEPRKNHLLLLDVWRKLVEQLGTSAPHLVIVGSVGWSGAEILDKFDKCDITRSHIHPVSGLSSPALRHLMERAVALLMPSLNEGFGLPIVEAKKLGVRVIVSDIPAHREVAGNNACLLPADDVDAWVKTILNWPDKQVPPEIVEHAPEDYVTPEQYGRIIIEFLDQCAKLPRTSCNKTEDVVV